MRQASGPRKHEATGREVPGDLEVAKLKIMQFPKGYGFLLLSHDSWKGGSLRVWKSGISQHALSPLISTLVMG